MKHQLTPLANKVLAPTPKELDAIIAEVNRVAAILETADAMPQIRKIDDIDGRIDEEIEALVRKKYDILYWRAPWAGTDYTDVVIRFIDRQAGRPMNPRYKGLQVRKCERWQQRDKARVEQAIIILNQFHTPVGMDQLNRLYQATDRERKLRG